MIPQLIYFPYSFQSPLPRLNIQLIVKPTGCRSTKKERSAFMTAEMDDRKLKILQATAKLIAEKGLANTSTNDIAREVGIARGTLYHHFASKEEIIDRLVDQTSDQLFDKARQIALQKDLPIAERLTNTLLALNPESAEGKILADHIHQKDNLILHHKVQGQMIDKLPQILLPIIEDGIEQGIFQTDYPLECLELLVVYVLVVINEKPLALNQDQSKQRIIALLSNLDRLFSSQAGFFLQAFMDSPYGQNLD